MHVAFHPYNSPFDLLTIIYFYPVPPYGQDNLPTLQSIFDVEHLRENAYFLDTQCPCPAYSHNFSSLPDSLL